MAKPPQNSSQSFQDKIKETYKSQRSYNISDIEYASLNDLVGLLALLRTWASEDMTVIQPLEAMPCILFPTVPMVGEFLGNMFSSGMLQVDTERSAITAFVEQPDTGGISWYNYRAALQPAIYTSGSVLDVSEAMSLLQGMLQGNLSIWQKRELPSLMRAIAIGECVQYLQFMLSDHGFDSDVGEKTQLMFDEMLEEMSVSQILPCIWSAVKSAAAFLQSANCKGRKHAYNTIQGKIRDAAARRQSGELNLTNFDRGEGCTRSQVSIELYGEMGFDADIGFTTRLADIPIPKGWQEELDDDEAELGAKFTTHEKLVLEEAGYYECSDTMWERPLICLNREVTVRKLLQPPPYEIRVNDVSKPSEPVKIASAKMNDFTSLVVFTDAMEKSDLLEHAKQQQDEATDI